MFGNIVLHDVLAFVFEITRHRRHVHLEGHRRTYAPVSRIVLQSPVRGYDPQFEANLVSGVGDPHPHDVPRDLVPAPDAPFVLAAAPAPPAPSAAAAAAAVVVGPAAQ